MLQQAVHEHVFLPLRVQTFARQHVFELGDFELLQSGLGRPIWQVGCQTRCVSTLVPSLVPGNRPCVRMRSNVAPTGAQRRGHARRRMVPVARVCRTRFDRTLRLDRNERLFQSIGRHPSLLIPRTHRTLHPSTWQSLCLRRSTHGSSPVPKTCTGMVGGRWTAKKGTGWYSAGRRRCHVDAERPQSGPDGMLVNELFLQWRQYEGWKNARPWSVAQIKRGRQTDALHACLRLSAQRQRSRW
mmetsp:Transcript_639/g.4290  ORF Transcript_639/g.4290 Transcript_639/m.4290 type:complete len:242 (+) Transcript_639:1087-1812(+)